jgi:transcriptional regulator with XRE-family HTH domain
LNGTQIRKLMRQKGVRITELARIVGVKHSHISNILAGRKRPSIELALRISRFFQVSVNDLMLVSDDATESKRIPQSEQLAKEVQSPDAPLKSKQRGGDEFD